MKSLENRMVRTKTIPRGTQPQKTRLSSTYPGAESGQVQVMPVYPGGRGLCRYDPRHRVHFFLAPAPLHASCCVPAFAAQCLANPIAIPRDGPLFHPSRRHHLLRTADNPHAPSADARAIPHPIPPRSWFPFLPATPCQSLLFKLARLWRVIRFACICWVLVAGKFSLAAGRVLRSCKVSYFRLPRPVSWFRIVSVLLLLPFHWNAIVLGLEAVVVEELSAVLRAWCFRARCRLFGVIGILLLA